MKRLARITLAATFLAVTCAHAEIFKLAVPSDTGMTLIWWPVLPSVSGWTHDEETSRHFAANMLTPKGQSFANAPAVMYGKASFKPRAPDTHSVAELIQQDIAEHKTNVEGLVVTELPPVRDGDGKALRYFQFSPSGAGAWELVAYGEEDEYFLLFVVSAQTKVALQAARPTFESLVSRYKKRPNKSLERTRER
jgi:hypothetical protein